MHTPLGISFTMKGKKKKPNNNNSNKDAELSISCNKLSGKRDGGISEFPALQHNGELHTTDLTLVRSSSGAASKNTSHSGNRWPMPLLTQSVKGKDHPLRAHRVIIWRSDSAFLEMLGKEDLPLWTPPLLLTVLSHDPWLVNSCPWSYWKAPAELEN